ncbi:MAG: D-hexose-6-phosphate mutarotase [Deltaproteobacteria bacterium]|nr:D-hexose-6-phosphate mutarotase [Deltaproteobacteria bacterium]
MVSELNMKFGISEALTFQSGAGGLVKALLRHVSGAEAEVYLYGAHVTAWRSPAQGELLFLSNKAVYGGGKAIRGGIPVIFPQFSGLGNLPTHGFARTALWKVDSSHVQENGDVVLKLYVSDQEISQSSVKELWPHRFRFTYSVVLSERLRTDIEILNQGTQPLSFQLALHTYFNVSAIENVAVKGLKGLKYLDNVKNREEGLNEESDVKFSGEYDRIFLQAPDRLEISDKTRTFVIDRRNMPDAVVWNPWIEKCKSLTDMEPADYKRMVCVESGNIVPSVSLGGGETFSCSQTLSVK